MIEPTRHGGALAWLLAALFALMLSTAQAADGVANGAKLHLLWELQRPVAGAQLPQGTTPARFVLTNRDTQTLPARGWSLYFNAIERMPKGVQSGGLQMEQVAGDLSRLRPAPGFKGLAPGQSLEFRYPHTDSVHTSSKAPSGPYLVYDAAPGSGVRLDYLKAPLVQPAQAGVPGSPHSLLTPQDIYERNARATLLPATDVPKVFPTPLQLRESGARLPLRGAPTIQAPPVLEREATRARALFPGTSSSTGGPVLRLAIGSVPGQSSPEAYSLDIVAPGMISIVGNSAAGVAHGVQTLRDLMPLPGAESPSIPVLSIVDAPRFGYRGFMLDVARNFQHKQTVFKWLDLMARFKLNKFHFHLTDDEGWRLEIAGLPELTAIGAVRGHAARPGVRLQPAYGSGPDPVDASGTGYYSRADYIDILRHAAALHIEVIPEIEMPGHARAAVQAMEARYHRLKAAGDKDFANYLLNDLADRSVYESAQMFGDNVINPGLASSYTFIEHVVTEVAAMHREAGVPLKTIHMGGDELADGAWEQSPVSQAWMKRHGLASTAALWDDFYDRVDGIVRKHGLVMSGWEELAARREIVDGRPVLTPNPHFTRHGFTAYVWNNTPGNEDLAYRLANAGYDIVLTPVTRMYLDMAHNANPDEHGVNWGAYVDLDTVYDFIPFDMNKRASGLVGLSEDGKGRVRGLQGNLFSEAVRDEGRLGYLTVPRLAAVAERAWAPDPDWAREADPVRARALRDTAWTGFVNALGQRVLPRLDLEGTGIAWRIAPPGLRVAGDAVLVNHVLPGLTLRYTRDGSTPGIDSPVVNGPIAGRGLIQVAAFDRNGRRGALSRIDRR